MLGEPDPDAVVADRLNRAALVAGDPLGLDAPAERVPEVGATDQRHDARVSPAAVPPMPAATAATEEGAFPRVSPGVAAVPIRAEHEEHLEEHFREPGIVELDLTNALTDLTAGHMPMHDKRPPAKGDSLDEVFQEFRDEVLREDVKSEAAQHYKLALTYLDMAMPEEAVKPLEAAVRTPRFRFQAASLLGRIHRQQGRTAEAIEWFERAAETPASSVQSARALLYELAETLEGAGETARALAVYLELQADAGEYRDVGARIERLSQPDTGD
jgi:hypothetical protein